QVSIDSKPSGAKIYIDGNAAGTTPFEGKLKAGEHEVRLVARGYYVFNETVKVAAADNVPMRVTLKGSKGSGGKSSKGKSSGSDEPAPTPEPKPKEPSSSKKGSPFLPTAKGDPKPTPTDDAPKKKSGSPFLPTKD